MKKLLFLVPVVAMVACGNNETAENKHEGHDHSKAHAETHAANAGDSAISYLTHDPMCKMVREDSWTLYSVYNGDTVKFCADYCKKAFDANPEKYAIK